MQKFKEGQKVRLVADKFEAIECGLVIGNEYIIQKYDDDYLWTDQHYMVESVWVCESDLEAV